MPPSGYVARQGGFMKRVFLNMTVAACLFASAGPGLAAALPLAGFSAPVGVLEMPDGALLVAEWGGNRISRVDNSGKNPVLNNISAPAGMASDNDGNIYIAGYSDGNVYVWNGEDEAKILAKGFSQPTGLLWSRDNTLLVANRGAGTIEEIDGNGARRVISRGHVLPVGIAETASGDMYVSCYGGTLDRVSKNGAIQKISNGLNRPGVGILPAGRDTVYIVDNAAGKIVEAGANGVIRTLAANLSEPVGLAKSARGDLIVATWGDGKIQLVERKMGESSRYERGMAMLDQIDGEGGHKVVEALKDIAPEFGKYLVEFPFGDFYSRKGADLRTREIATIAALAALGNAIPQLRIHLAACLNVGCSRTEIVEILMQMAVYAGFPAALNALFAAKEVFMEADSKEAVGG